MDLADSYLLEKSYRKFEDEVLSGAIVSVLTTAQRTNEIIFKKIEYMQGIFNI